MHILGSRTPQTTKKIIVVAATIVTVVVIAAGIIVWQAFNRTNQSSDAPDALRDRLISKISRYLELPNDEKPTVARIKDPAQVSQQPFFKNAKEGDYLLVYEDEGTAILYREQTDKLVKVGTITVREAQQAPLKPGEQ